MVETQLPGQCNNQKETRWIMKKAQAEVAAAAPLPTPSATTSSVYTPASRLSGKVFKRNAGFLRQWRQRSMYLTSDGYLRYEKKKGDNVRVKETDLVKSHIGPHLTQQGTYYCIGVQAGQNHFLLGFESKSEAKLWQEVMFEVADENAAGRRLWMGHLRRVLTLTLRDRRDLVDRMGERDWLTEWNFCWRALRNNREDDFNGRRRRVKRLYAIWLQFQMFAEVAAEVHFAKVQSTDEYRIPRASDAVRPQSDSSFSDRRSNASSGAESSASTSSTSRKKASEKALLPRDDVDVLHLKTVTFEYGSKSWRGEKRLDRDMAELARFRRTLEDVVASHGLHDAMVAFPTFPLMAAFTMRTITVIARAEPLSEETEIIHVDKRDLNELVSGIRLAGCLGRFDFGEFPEMWVRGNRNAPDSELLRVASRYDDVLHSSLRSNMVHGVLIRAGSENRYVEALSSHDVDEIVEGKSSRWTPYLDLLYYHLDPDSTSDNVSAKQFLMKKPKSISCKGDMVIAIDPVRCRLPLNLKQGFVERYQIELLPVLRRLQEAKHSSQQMQSGAEALGAKGVRNIGSDPSIFTGLELTVKQLLHRHIKEVASRLVALGDDIPSVVSGLVKQQSANSSYIRQSSPDLAHAIPSYDAENGGIRRRGVSVADLLAFERPGGGGRNGALYVIDAIHLRRVLKQQGINMRFLPLMFLLTSSVNQPGVRTLVAAQIVARIAKRLFKFRLFHDQNAEQSRWRSRKSRLIDFIALIMRGLQDDDSTLNQFWGVEGPIWLLLGPYSSSIALSDIGTIQPQVMMETYRQSLATNPEVLFNCLLRNLEAHLNGGYLPAIGESQWHSLPFLRREGQLSFFDEAVDPKLALTYHAEWLAATTQSFRIQFDNLQRIFVNGGGSVTSKSEIQNPKVFFSTLMSNFRHSLAFQGDTRLESALFVQETQGAARDFLLQALSALREFRLDTARDLVRQGWELLSTKGAHVSFPLEMNVFALALLGLSDRDAVMTPRDPKNKAKVLVVQSKWRTLLAWLHHFYRTASKTQALSSLCPHPLAEAICHLDGGVASRRPCVDLRPPAPSSTSSLRSKIERAIEMDLWEDVTPVIDRQFHLSTARNGANPAVDRHSLIERTSSLPAHKMSVHPLHATDLAKRSASDTLAQRASADWPIGPGESSWDRVLRLLEHLFVPSLSATKGCWLIPGYLFDPSQAQQAQFPPMQQETDSVSAPGMALMWGRSTGLSLDDEAKLSVSSVDGINCRPRTIMEVSVIELPLPLRRVAQVSCGYRHTALITDGDRKLYTFGYGECGRLGHGDEMAVDVPTPVEFLASLATGLGGPDIAGVRQVACGREHTMAVLVNGDLYGFGWAEAGRLGTGESGAVTLPSKVSSLKGVQAVACGREHTLALNRSGKVCAFGAGFGGRLGTGRESDEDFPVGLMELKEERVVAIDAGECHSCALTEDGKVFTWGFGSSGALGTGSRDNALLPVQVDFTLDDDRVTAIACGSYHTLAATEQGKLFGWGDAAAGQLGDKMLAVPDMVVLKPERIRLPRFASFQGETEVENSRHSSVGSVLNIQAIACGTFTSALATTEGKLYVWGSAAAGNGAKLDPEDSKPKLVSVVSEFQVGHIACGAYHTVVVTQAPRFT